MIRFAAIGECMIELRHRDDETLALGFAGDTYNTAVYVARSSTPADISVDYVTVIGDDHYSDAMLDAMRAEGIGLEGIARRSASSPGLYLVRTDPDGERHFTYHRSTSPARSLFTDRDVDLSSYDVVYLSAVTLQILSPDARERLWTQLELVRSDGVRVAFDSNYRVAGWPSVADARAAIERTLMLTDIALPTFSDEQLLYGDADAAAACARIAALGVPEVVVKDGANGCAVWADREGLTVAAQRVATVVDTTAAGDSFNGAYLAARLTGATARVAAAAGHALASLVIQHPGAILPPSVVPRRR
ncbi:MAG: PfkB domain protein [Frankiales bacterium]|nr:PfkB domain protein [Frankiales bacterium]